MISNHVGSFYYFLAGGLLRIRRPSFGEDEIRMGKGVSSAYINSDSNSR
jgi:hypothetical protein